MRSAPVLAVALLLLAQTGVARAAKDLDLRITSLASGRELARRSVRLGDGEEVQFERKGMRLPGRAGAVDLIFGVTLRAAGRDAVTVELHGILRDPGAATPLAWTARTYTLRDGEAAAFVVSPPGAPAGVEFAARVGTDETARPEVDPVRFWTTLRVREVTAAGDRLVEERAVRLVGPEPTRIVLEGAAGAGEEMILLLSPRARDDDGALLDVAIETRPRAPSGRVVREETLRLGWNDVVSVTGLSGPRGPVVIDLKPER